MTKDLVADEETVSHQVRKKRFDAEGDADESGHAQ